MAELESGKGNISILRLRRIAIAMGITAADLVADPGLDSPAFAYLMNYIRHAGAAELNRLYAGLQLAPRSPTPRIIALTGLRGAGKSSVGSVLAKRLDVPFVEVVGRIEAAAGMAVSEIFSLGGQTTYRRLERQCLAEIIDGDVPQVIAVGGSVVSEPGTYELLLGATISVWLRAGPEEHMGRVIAQGDERPMAGNSRAMDDLKRILAERERLYQRADYVINTSQRSIDETVDEILNLPLVNTAFHAEEA